MRKIKSSNFDRYVTNLCQQNRTFVVESKRNVSSLYMNKQMVLLTKNENQKFGEDRKKIQAIIHFFGQVQGGINRHLKKIGFQVEPLKKRYTSSKTDREKWGNMADGEVFYYIDVKHCFWRISYLNDYIGKNLYERVLEKEDFKFARNMSLALIVAPRTRKYYKNGVLICEITEERTMYRIIYDNIRFEAYNLMGDCMKIAKQHFIAYRTDGILLDKKALKRVCRFIDDNNLTYAIKECYKIDDRHYSVDGTEKKLF